MADISHNDTLTISIPRRLRIIILCGIACGTALYLLVYGAVFDAEMIGAFILVSCFYVTVMWGVQEMTLRVLIRRIPIVSKRAVGVHVLIQGFVTVGSFFLASALIHVVFGLDFVNSRGSMIVIGLVAFCASLAANGAYYLEIFHTRAREAERLALRAELGALRAQINPHFLFNSLNSIAALIRIDPAGAERVTESLADLFRYSLRSSQRSTVTLGEEIESVEIYIEIEQARFGDRMTTAIEVPEELRGALVPSLLLQPLVENGVKHGVGRITTPCAITLRATSAGKMISLRVTDTGPGFTSTDIERALAGGTGLANVRDRLRLQFGDAASLIILGNGVELIFPRIIPAPGAPPRHDALEEPKR
jgi:signal transduction histidine kinase